MVFLAMEWAIWRSMAAVAGLRFSIISWQKSSVGLAFFRGQNNNVTGEAMAGTGQIVAGRDLFALCRFGAGGCQGVAAIGVKTFV